MKFCIRSVCDWVTPILYKVVFSKGKYSERVEIEKIFVIEKVYCKIVNLPIVLLLVDKCVIKATI